MIAVSAADVSASQPYVDTDHFKSQMKKGLRKNRNSKFFPYIHNVPRIWPGRDAYNDFEFETKGLELRRNVLNSINT